MVEFQVLVPIFFIVAYTVVWSGNTANIGILNKEDSLRDSMPLNSTSLSREDGYPPITEVDHTSSNESNDPGFIVSENYDDEYQPPSDTDWNNLVKVTYPGFTVSESDNVFNITDIVVPVQNSLNITCVRMDYDEDVAAVFKGEAGPIETASVVFNSTFINFRDGIIYNITDITGLEGFNETIVDCDLYFEGPAIQRKLNSLTMSSLVG